MVRYCYIVAEGPQDIEFLICLLKFYGLRRVTRLSSLDSFWEPLVPRTFPVDDDLIKRVPVPIFLQNTELSVALHSAIAITRLSNTIEESLALIPSSQIFGIGLFLDADDIQSPQHRFNDLTDRLTLMGLLLPAIPGQVMQVTHRIGVFIAPNNSKLGALEDILLDCAQENHPNLLDLPRSYVSRIDTDKLTRDDLRELNKPAGRNKAII
jgi:hypothetical protein